MDLENVASVQDPARGQDSVVLAPPGHQGRGRPHGVAEQLGRSVLLHNHSPVRQKVKQTFNDVIQFERIDILFEKSI